MNETNIKQKICLSEIKKMYKFLNEEKINTVCIEAKCPNIGDCFKNKTATFMILGDVCTRNCLFCNIKKGATKRVDKAEGEKMARMAKKMNLSYVTITSVTRDDLSDGGANHFVRVIKDIRKINPKIKIEVLIPDFNGKIESLKKVVKAKPEVISHNLETVSKIYPKIRPKASYRKSLRLIRLIKSLDSEIIIKTGLMLGLGESRKEIIKTMKDLKGVCDILTLGQYLAPTKKHYIIKKYLTKDEFDELKRIGEDTGIPLVFSGTFVRSSFHAEECYNLIKK